MGIDPGIATMGWGVIKTQSSKKRFARFPAEYKTQNSKKGKNSIPSGLTLVDFGCIKTPPEQVMPQRLKHVYRELLKLIKLHQPQLIAIERLFFGMNSKTAMTVGQARGIILLATANFPKVEIAELAPLAIKSRLTGYGRTDKNGMKEAVKRVLKLKELPKSDDAADALAVAICATMKNAN